MNAVEAKTKNWRSSYNYSFIGCGHMALALLGAMLANGVQPSQLTAVRRDVAKLAKIKDAGVRVSTSVVDGLKADVIFLGVKPQQLSELCSANDIKISENSIVVSMLAGVSLERLEKAFVTSRVVRIMPNLACGLSAGVVGCYQQFATKLPEFLVQVFACFGYLSLVKKEEDLDMITALAGSGIAYYYQLNQALQESAVRRGFNSKEAQAVTDQALVGAGLLLQQERRHRSVGVQDLIAEIAVKGGTTELALRKLVESGIFSMCHNAVDAVLERCRALNKG